MEKARGWFENLYATLWIVGVMADGTAEDVGVVTADVLVDVPWVPSEHLVEICSLRICFGSFHRAGDFYDVHFLDWCGSVNGRVSLFGH